jgi:hypothetical protein
MKRLLIVCIAALTAAGSLAEDAAARARRPRVVITAPRYDSEPPGTIYGYAPGNYVLGRNGVLYGPYPLNRNVAFRYGVGPDGWYGEQYRPDWYGWYGPAW